MQKDWARRTAKERSQVLRRWYNLIIASADDLALILTAEQEKPLAEAKAEVISNAANIEWFAKEAKRIDGDVIPGASPRHMRELAATVNVWRGRDGPSPLHRSDAAVEIDALTFADMDGRTRRFDEALFDTYDGIAVLHRGHIAFERYFGALSAELPHSRRSITKSYAGTLAASLVHEGVLDDGKANPVLPARAARKWLGGRHATQVMDMRTGLAHTEDYADDRALHRARGLQRHRPRHPALRELHYVNHYDARVIAAGAPTNG